MHRAAALGTLDQVGAGQHVEVLHDRRQRHRERCRKLGHGQLRFAGQTVDDGAPGRIRQGGEGEVELGATKVNHMVKYRRASVEVKRVRFTIMCALTG
jgi:hypothetical protein